MNFTEDEIQQIKTHGLTKEKVTAQINSFVHGIPYTEIIKPATINDGILLLSQEEQKQCEFLFNSKKNELQLVKFVPASGAATRMFEALYIFIENYNPEKESLASYFRNNHSPWLEEFLDKKKQFAFFKKLDKKFKTLYPNHLTFCKEKYAYTLIKTLLSKEGLNYSNLPKGLLLFHAYKNKNVTAFEEQLTEAAGYLNKECRIHFTVSKNHLKKFEKQLKKIKPRVEKQTACEFKIDFSFQKNSTDTVAVTTDNRLFRTEKGKLLFRPSGHGALIENLNEINSDIIFIKNIDNVVLKKDLTEVIRYKKILAGKLLEIQNQIFQYLHLLDKNQLSENEAAEIQHFIKNQLQIPGDNFSQNTSRAILNRPIRICGMVKNTGAPGGGPFWVKDKENTMSLQIVEVSQIAINNPEQATIVNQSSHFNPVDLVCGVRNYKGEKFELNSYINPNSGFISEKNYQGKKIKSLELPGLWNGAMAQWITLFVEVPLITFNPVKVVNDLLKPSHHNPQE